MAMEPIEGPTLREEFEARARTGRRVSEVEAIAVASSISEAHACGLVHRDLKPENVMTDRGRFTRARMSRAALRFRRAAIFAAWG